MVIEYGQTEGDSEKMEGSRNELDRVSYRLANGYKLCVSEWLSWRLGEIGYSLRTWSFGKKSG